MPKRRKNLEDHGIDFADLGSFFDGDLLTREDGRIDYGERRYQTIGLIFGVPLFVVWTPRGAEEDQAHLIFARKAAKMKKKHGSLVTGRDAGGTDWEKLRQMKDEEIRFTADAPQTSVDDWAEAAAHRGLPLASTKTQIALRVDSDVLAWFKSQGPRYQTKMNAVLRAYRDARQRA